MAFQLSKQIDSDPENSLTETYGNGVIATSGYDQLTGRLTSIAAGTGNAVQNQTYHYDSVGNLDTRTDAISGTNETFFHDSLNRLVTANLSGPGVTGVATTTVGYNAIGNITSKTSTLASYNLGNYTYAVSGAGSVRPHAVASVAGTVNGVANPTYGYDANGNLTDAYGKQITWTSFDMPASIAKGTGASSFLYSPEHQRVKQMWPNPTAPTNTTVYLFDPQYEKEINGSLTEHKHYILAGSRIDALYTKRSDATEDTKYFHADHLGSTSVVTDGAGNVLERMAYDPWGDRRASSSTTAGAADPTNAIIPSTTDRGYTGHEHLDQGGMGLVHMNGRIYDPTLGRFLSPDPYIQSPYHSQSYNRYSYVWNNPLTNTDPTGYLSDFSSGYAVTIICFSSSCGGGGSAGSDGGADYSLFGLLERLAQQFVGGVTANLGQNDKPQSGSNTTSVDDNPGSAGAPYKPDCTKVVCLEGAITTAKRLNELGQTRRQWADFMGPYLFGFFDGGSRVGDRGRSGVLRQVQPPLPKGVISLKPSTIRFSQSSVNGVSERAENMWRYGWQEAPIDVVKMPDGKLTTFDNTRLLAADLAGIDVQAVVHEAGEAFPAGRWMSEKGTVPATWGEAVSTRIQQQNRLYRETYPMGSPATGAQ